MGRIECVCSEKLQHDFVSGTYALIAPVHPILHRVSCSYETIPNAPKDYETLKNKSVGFDGVGRVRSLQQILIRLRGTIFCINCTSSVCFAPCFVQLRNHPKWTQKLCNARKHEFRVQWGGSSAFVAKNYNVTLARTFALIAPIHPILHRVSCSYKTISNAPKHYETH